MKSSTKIATALIATSFVSSLVYLAAHAQQLPMHQTAQASNGGVVVELCDGVTKTEVKGLKPGQAMTHEQALAVTGSLMEEWARKHPGEHWQMAQDAAGSSSTQSSDEANSPAAATDTPNPSPAPSTAPTNASTEEATPEKTRAAEPSASISASSRNPSVSGPGRKPGPIQQGDTYASFNQRDIKIWQANTENFIQEGKEVFHSADKLGGTIGVSCDMCHPDAANTHPETYPKYQVQLQRVALLRDMIEWCIENPVKGKTMDPNDPRLRAMEAYIIAQRKGVPLEYGKH
jgi:thiosulfate dehydrogenase